MIRLRQILFVPPAPIVWAQRLALFGKHGVEVETTQTASSDQLGQGLADGTWDVGVGVVDNVIAWNQERGAGLQIVAQLERSTVMAFCGAARYATLAAAAAEPIAVDSTTNGFVLVLYRALAREGIDWHGCRYDAIGGVRHRFEALETGKAASTILIPPFIDMALAKGFRKLWDGADVAPAYPGVVLAARAAWLRQNEGAALGYLARCSRRTPGPRAPRTSPRPSTRWSRRATPRARPDGWCATSSPASNRRARDGTNRSRCGASADSCRRRNRIPRR
ncbi:MAG: ABC transporter substrate-binding protein [Burkholderiales bacterium]|nr:ABC transporter substrate-binding protein [Burkholderiales bacterium]